MGKKKKIAILIFILCIPFMFLMAPYGLGVVALIKVSPWWSIYVVFGFFGMIYSVPIVTGASHKEIWDDYYKDK